MRRRGVASVQRAGGVSLAASVGLWLALAAGALAQANPPGSGGAIGLGNGDNEANIGLHEAIFSPLIAACDSLRKRDFLRMAE